MNTPQSDQAPRTGEAAHTPTIVNPQILSAARSTCNESNGRDMAGCLADGGKVICYFPTEETFDRFAPAFVRACNSHQALVRLAELVARETNESDPAALIDRLAALRATAKAALQLAK